MSQSGTRLPVQAAGSDIFIRKSSGLTRQIGAMDALIFCIQNNNVMALLVVLMFALMTFPGVDMYKTLLLGLLILPAVAVYWFLATAMPRSGGEYIYITRILSSPIGFMASAVVTVLFIAFVGIGPTWVASYALGPMFAGLYYATGSQGMLNAAQAVAQPVVQFIIGTVVLAFCGYIWARGPKSTMLILRISMIGGLLVMVLLLILAAAIGTGGFATNFDKVSGMTYQGILDAAKAASMPTSTGFAALMSATMAFIFLGLLGTTAPANFAGEVRGVQRSQAIALFGSVVGCLVIWGLLWVGLYGLLGHDFYQSLVFLAAGKDAAYALPADPSMAVLLGFTGLPLLVVFFGLAFAVNQTAATLTMGFASIRNIFAWAFDRLVPTRLAELDRNGQPLVTVIIVTVAGWLFLALQVFAPQWMTNLLFAMPAWSIVWIIVGIGATVFPFRRKELFAASPALVQKRLGTVPVISILGVLMIIVSCLSVYYSIQPYLTGTLIPIQGLILALIIVLVPLPIYYIAKAYYRSRGIYLEQQFTTLPPE